MDDCCERQDAKKRPESCCDSSSRKFDWLLWGSLLTVLIAYIAHLLFHHQLKGTPFVEPFIHGSFQLMNKIWWGLIAGIIAVSIIARIPRDLVIAALGKSGGLKGILRATAAGLAFDLCNHGILMVGMQLYRRGLSLGQTMAFLIASPWNSLSTTLVLIALIGRQVDDYHRPAFGAGRHHIWTDLRTHCLRKVATRESKLTVLPDGFQFLARGESFMESFSV